MCLSAKPHVATGSCTCTDVMLMLKDINVEWQLMHELQLPGCIVTYGRSGETPLCSCRLRRYSCSLQGTTCPPQSQAPSRKLCKMRLHSFWPHCFIAFGLSKRGSKAHDNACRYTGWLGACGCQSGTRHGLSWALRVACCLLCRLPPQPSPPASHPHHPPCPRP